MAKVLVILGTMIPKENSYSTAVTNLYLEEYKKVNPNDEIEIMDLNDSEVAKISLTRDNMATFWDEKAMAEIEKLKSIDKLVMVSPMINFNVSTLIKNYLDHVLMANQLFSYKYSKKGDAIGLLTNLEVQVITTQGAPMGWYPFGNTFDYLNGTWEFCGAKTKKPIVLAGTKVSPLKEMLPSDAAKTLIDEIKESLKLKNER